MTDPTDAELGALLVDTFRSRETLVDLEDAVRIARDARDPRPRWPVLVAAAASVGLLVTGTAYVVDRLDPAAGPSHPHPTTSASPTPGPTDADHHRAAAREAARVLRLAPLPSGAVHLTGRPAGWPRDAGVGMSPSDESLTRTAWYSVPAAAAEVRDFVLSHVPDGMSGDGLGSSVGVQTYTYEATEAREPAAYTAPSLIIQWYDTGATTVIRFDAVLAARHARTPDTYLTGTVTSVDVDRTVDTYDGTPPRPLATIRLTRPHNADQLDRLVTAMNGLHGSPISTTIHSCLPRVRTTFYRLTFHTDDGAVTYQWIDGCDIEIGVSRDGKQLAPHLDPGTIDDTLSAVLRGHSG